MSIQRLHACALLGAVFACNQPQRNQGALATLAGLVDGARRGDPDGLAAVATRGATIAFLSSPYRAGNAIQGADRDGLLVQPAFADGRPAGIVTTEIYDGYPRVWAQPLYLFVSGFDPAGGPVKLAVAPVFGVAPTSRFYSPYWQTFYVTVPAGFDPEPLRSAASVLSSGLALTPGPLRLCSIGPRELEIAHPAGSQPVHPFTGDPVAQRLAQQAWAEDELVWFLDFGLDRFRVADLTNVVQEVALFRFALLAADGTPRVLALPPTVGTGPFRAPRAADAPGGLPRFGALRHEYVATITPRAGQPRPGVFVSASLPALRAQVIKDLGPAFVPAPSGPAELLPERFQYTLRVALDGSCFGLTDFPNSCLWLDTQQAIEGNLPVTAFTDTRRFSAGALVQFDGVAP